jgi:hypothetical protein
MRIVRYITFYGLLSFSQKQATEYDPEPNVSILHSHTFFQTSLLILSSYLCVGIPCVSSFRILRLKCFVYFCYPCTLHDSPNSLSVTYYHNNTLCGVEVMNTFCLIFSSASACFLSFKTKYSLHSIQYSSPQDERSSVTNTPTYIQNNTYHYTISNTLQKL